MLLEQGGLGTLTWSQASSTLPPGITLGANGILSGTPTAAGSFTFTVQVTDSNTRTATSGTFTINVSLVPLAFTSNTMPAAGAGKLYSQPLPVVGGTLPYGATVASGTIPPGLTLSGNGILSGTPSGAGSFTFTATVTDSSTPAQTATQTLTIAVDTLFITTTALPNGIVGVPYNVVISTIGGTLPLPFSQANTAFPPGLAIQQPAANSHSGALAGTPTLAGHYTFSESVSDSSTPAQTATQYYVMDVFPAGTSAPATVTFLTQPQNSIGGQILSGSPIRVHVTDVSNAPITGASVAIRLNGVTNGLGNAVFLDLSIDRGQLGYTLLASTGSASAVSQPFTVNGFCETGSLNVARALHAAVELPDGRVLMAGGFSNITSGTTALASAEIYDPVAHSFTAIGNMNSPRGQFTVILLSKGLVLVAGGIDGSTVLSSAELFDPSTNKFSLLAASMSTARTAHTATLLASGKVLITGGTSNTTTLTSAEIFDPATNTFTPTASPMAAARQVHHANLLPNGQVLITGGFGLAGGTVLASAELYDPVANTFTSTGSMATSRANHASTLLSTGQVLVAGGVAALGNGNVGPTSTAELYDPLAGTFSPTSNATRALSGFYSPVPTLPDGTVFLADGATNAQIYDPASGTFRATENLANQQTQPQNAILPDGRVPLTGGSLPTGIALNANGILRGTPTAAGSFVFTAQLADSSVPAKKTSVTFSLTVNGPTGLTVVTRVLPSGVIGVSYFQTLSAAGGAQPYSWRVIAGLLPTGLNLSNTAQISGTPTASGTFNCVVQVTDSAGTAVFQSLTITINPPLAITTTSLPGSAPGLAYNQTLVAAGGAGVYAWSFVSGALPPGIALSSAGVLSGTPTTTGSFTFTVKVTDLTSKSASATYTVNIVTALSAGTHILFIIQPGQNNTGQNGLQGLVQLFDSNNAPIPGVELAASFGAKGCPDAALTGTLTAVTDANGLAAFSGISSTRGGQAYTAIVSATSNPNVSATSNPFSIAGFCATGSLRTLRREDTVALLPNGKALIVGGLNSNGVPTVALNSAEIYDPTTGLSASTGSMTTVRDLATATVLPNGKVLIVGGYDATGTVLATAELYNPNTGSFSTT
jgi:hypothetical protein